MRLPFLSHITNLILMLLLAQTFVSFAFDIYTVFSPIPILFTVSDKQKVFSHWYCFLFQKMIKAKQLIASQAINCDPTSNANYLLFHYIRYYILISQFSVLIKHSFRGHVLEAPNPGKTLSIAHSWVEHIFLFLVNLILLRKSKIHSYYFLNIN